VPVAPKLAQHPLTGFGLTFGVSLLRSGFLLFFAPHPAAILHRLEEIGMALCCKVWARR
jgi:hypothetical protein